MGTRSDTAYEAPHWMPSRFNVRAKTEEGGLLLWNSFTGSMNAFKQEQLSMIVPLLSRKGCHGEREGIIAYLADRGYLIEQGTEEYREVKSHYRERETCEDRLGLIIMPTEDCNFRCRYCYQKFARGMMQPSVRAGLKELVRRKAPSLSKLDISWFGGEPLYAWPVIEELAPLFQDLSHQFGFPYASNITTNGYLLTQERATQLLAWGVNHFQITLDGLPAHHDCNRPTRDGQPTFEVIYQNLRQMAERSDGFSVVIRVNLDQENSQHLEAFLDDMRDAFVDDPRFRFDLHGICKFGGDNDEQLDVLGPRERNEVLRRMNREILARGMRIRIDDYSLGGRVCYAANPYVFVVNTTGQLMKCTVALDEMEENVVGHLAPDGSLNLLEERHRRWTEPAFERDAQCRSCSVLPVCQGSSCPLVRIERDARHCIPERNYAKSLMREWYGATTSQKRHISV